MSAPATVAEIRTDQGFPCYVLRSAECAVTVIPQLGARVASLLDLGTGREWLWAPSRPPRLFTNRPGDPFPHSPLVGVDECFPSVSSCELGGRHYPDHGEAWFSPWRTDEVAWVRGVIATEVELLAGTLRLRREITLSQSTVRFGYSLKNLSPSVRPYLWALHPLLCWERGDRIELPSAVTKVAVEAFREVDAPSADHWSWPNPGRGVNLSTGQFGTERPGFAKVFAGPETGGVASLVHGRTGARLTLSWDVRQNPWLGVWISSGGWNGYQQVALEPTTSPHDSLLDAFTAGNAATIAAGETRVWALAMTLARLESD